jgi:predicted nucleotidyltransferase
MSTPEKYGKRRQITFRIGPIAQDRLERAAELFDMKPSQYAKAVLYRDLGVFNEPLDRRRRTWKRKERSQQLEEEEDFDIH